jgi:hypothetical protein
LAFFHALFPPDDTYDLLAEETNRYARQKNVPGWVDTTGPEMGLFLAVTLAMSHQIKSQIKDYWSTNPISHSPFFARTMSRDRYMQIRWNLHFSDNSVASADRLHKIKPILNILRRTFKEAYSPGENLCVDESLLLWKGPLSFKQFNPNKRARFGIKLFVLCDATSYVLDLIFYTGAATELDEKEILGVSTSVVTTLMAPYLDVGHKLYVDNWYTSPNLFLLLHDRKTNACGTVRINRKNMPKFSSGKLSKGEVEAFVSGVLLAERWMDKREVRMLSTLHVHFKA